MPPKGSRGLYIPRVPQKQTSRALRSSPPQGPVDIRQTKEYKAAASKWTRTIVALPIVMYTSWILYERIYGNKSPKKLVQKQDQDSSES